MPNDTAPQAPIQESTPNSLIRKWVAFLTQDIVLRPRPGEPKSGRDPAVPSQGTDALAQEAVPPLTDPERLAGLAFRRTVLNWRDNTQAEMALAIMALQDAFIQHIDIELKKSGLRQRVFAKTAVEVLQGEFVRQVRAPLIICLRRQEAAWVACAGRSTPLTDEIKPWSFDTRQLSAEYGCMHQLKFKPAQREAIVQSLRDFLTGSQGLEADLREQVRQAAQQLIDRNRLPC